MKPRRKAKSSAKVNHRKIHKVNREYKDSVFVDLFFSDEKARENVLSLYNALHGTELEDPEQIHLMKVDDVLYKNFKNDISFELGGRFFVFGEHQSTVNPNMPLRCLMYAGRAYERIVDVKERYKKEIVRIPAPEFFVFYNGEEDAPLEEELRLSAAYEGKAGENSLELTVKVININLGKDHEILKKCRVLREYSMLIDMIRRNQKAKSSHPVKEAVRECIKKGILSEYLARKGSEVINMLIAEYDYDMDIQVTREEAMEKGRREGRREGRKEGLKQGVLLSKISFIRRKHMKDILAAGIAEMLEEPVGFVEKVLSYFGDHPDWSDVNIANGLMEEK